MLISKSKEFGKITAPYDMTLINDVPEKQRALVLQGGSTAYTQQKSIDRKIRNQKWETGPRFIYRIRSQFFYQQCVAFISDTLREYI